MCSLFALTCYLYMSPSSTSKFFVCAHLIIVCICSYCTFHVEINYSSWKFHN